MVGVDWIDDTTFVGEQKFFPTGRSIAPVVEAVERAFAVASLDELAKKVRAERWEYIEAELYPLVPHANTSRNQGYANGREEESSVKVRVDDTPVSFSRKLIVRGQVRYNGEPREEHRDAFAKLVRAYVECLPPQR